VNVEDDQGFEVPFLITDLVKDARHGELSEAPKKPLPEKVSKEDKKPKKESLPLFASSAAKPATDHSSYYLAFVPEVPTSPLSGEIKAWLVNDSNRSLLYHFSLWKDGAWNSEKSGRLAPWSRIPLTGFQHPDFSDFPEFGFQLLPFENKSISLAPALVKTLKINPVKFYKGSSYSENSYFEKKSILFEIRKKELSPELEKLKQHDFSAPDVMLESGDISRPAPVPKREPLELKEVDLHIQELVESASGLSNKEMLDIQLDRFRSEMETAIRNGTKRIVFIHGVGQGTLKNELRRELEIKYKKYDMQDASFREYGYGATMVILRRG